MGNYYIEKKTEHNGKLTFIKMLISDTIEDEKIIICQYYESDDVALNQTLFFFRKFDA